MVIFTGRRVGMTECKTCKHKGTNTHICDECASYYSMYEKKIVTNAERIRSMSIEEMAEFFEQIVSGNRDVIGINCGNYRCKSWNCTECISIWLQSEAE